MNAEGAMNTPEVIKLSDVKVGQTAGESGGYENNDPVPLVRHSAEKGRWSNS